jgi:long-chain acyl-CoA synthetase
VLAEAPGVREVAVFGVDDERWGQRVCAAVVGEVREADVLAHARAHLAAYKCPKDVYLVDELPHTSTGKLRRLALPTELGLQGDGSR